MSRPSSAFVITIVGCTCASTGKPLRDVGNTIFCVFEVSDHTPTDCDMFHEALMVASDLPDASGAGYVSMPSPLVICIGVPPVTGTAQMWRRSMSLAFVQ